MDTVYYSTKFSLLTAGSAIRKIPLGNLMIKLDLKSGFHQLPLATSSFNHNGICYRGIKYSLPRLPMGHALAPYLFQRFTEAVLDEISLALNIDGIAYLDDWLLHSASCTDLATAIDMVEAMGITINYEKSIIEPTTSLQYLGFKVDSIDLTIQLTLTAFDRLTHVLRYTKNGSLLDRQRIRGYATWILYNLKMPIFLASDIMLGDASWLLAAIQHLSILQPKSLLPGLIPVSLYTDATPHSVAAIIPSLKMSFAQAFQTPEEINQAEAIALLLGLQWASSEFIDCHFTIHCDNSAVVATLSKGTGTLWRFHDLRRLHLSTLHGLRGNTFTIVQVTSAANLADRPSRAVLDTLHRTANTATLAPGEETDTSIAVPKGWL